MEGEIAFIIILVLGCLFTGVILGIVALVKIASLTRSHSSLERLVTRMSSRLNELTQSALSPPPEPKPFSAPPQPIRPLPPPVVPSAPLYAAPPRPETPLPQTPHLAPLPPLRPASPSPSPSEPSFDLEKLIGQRWMVWIGALVLIIATAVFVKYSFDQGWIGPTARIAMGILLGAVLLVLGDRFLRRKYRALGQGLMGAGIAILYVSLFAGFAWYHLFDQTTAFAAMVLVTAAGVSLAILHDAQPIALISVIGGFLTPVLVSTGQNSRDVLFSYLLLLDLGVLAVAFFRNWRLLDVLAFLGTVSLYAGWFDKFYAPSAMTPTLLWLAAFYLVFLLLPFLYHLRRSEEAPWTRFLMTLANAVFAFSYAWTVLHADYHAAAAFVALAIAACYAVMGVLTRRRIPGGFKQLLGFLAVATGFLVIAAPIHFHVDGIILAWAVEAPILLFVGYRYRYLPLRIMSFALLCIVTGYSLFAVWPDHHAFFVLVFNRKFLTALVVPLAAAAFALLHYRDRKLSEPLDLQVRSLTACASGLLAMIFLSGELSDWFRYADDIYDWRSFTDCYADCSYVFLWTVGGLIYSLLALKFRSLNTRLSAFGSLAVSVIFVLYFLATWSSPVSYFLFLNPRFTLCAFTVAVLFLLASYSRRRAASDPDESVSAVVLTSVASVLLLILLSVEAYQFSAKLIEDYQAAEWLALMSISVVWGLYAFVALVIGIRKRLAPLRYAALVLFAITVVKVLAFDTSQIRDLYRWIVLYATGFLLIAGSYLYYRLEKFMASSTQETPK